MNSVKESVIFETMMTFLSIVAVHLQNSEALTNWVAGFCQALLVDEMQDTSPLQWALFSH